jgi:hypothetical protein
MKHDNITDIATYLRAHAVELGERILSAYPALHQVDDPPSPRLGELIRLHDDFPTFKTWYFRGTVVIAC